MVWEGICERVWECLGRGSRERGLGKEGREVLWEDVLESSRRRFRNVIFRIQ